MRALLTLLITVFCALTCLGNIKNTENIEDTRLVDIGTQEKANIFYEKYLAKFYPKSLFITSNFFTGKDVQSVAGDLKAFIDLLADKPWFYVAEKQDGFKLACYWEFITDQCSLINQYIKRAYVDLENNTVYIPATLSYCYFSDIKKKEQRLLDALKSGYNEVLGAFYAFSFDYVGKLFNEGILTKDFVKARRYFDDLNFIMEKLQGTEYEAEYQEFMDIDKRIFALLKQKRDGDDAAFLDYLYGDDEKSKKLAQERMDLGGNY